MKKAGVAADRSGKCRRVWCTFNCKTMNSKSSMSAKLAPHRSVHSGFKSPLIRSADTQPDGASCSTPTSTRTLQKQNSCDSNISQQTQGREWDTERLQREVDDLKEQLREVEQRIQQLRDEGLNESELEEHINKLHEYNEIKDMAQMVLGHIATIQSIRTRDLYPKYGLELDD